MHCDWRYVDVPVEFFGAPLVTRPLAPLGLRAQVEDEGGGRLTTSAFGFDEGEPMRRWSAYDADHQLIAEAKGRRFRPPAGTTRVEVIVGAQVRLYHLLR